MVKLFLQHDKFLSLSLFMRAPPELPPHHKTNAVNKSNSRVLLSPGNRVKIKSTIKRYYVVLNPRRWRHGSPSLSLPRTDEWRQSTPSLSLRSLGTHWPLISDSFALGTPQPSVSRRDSLPLALRAPARGMNNATIPQIIYITVQTSRRSGYRERVGESRERDVGICM